MTIFETYPFLQLILTIIGFVFLFGSDIKKIPARIRKTFKAINFVTFIAYLLILILWIIIDCRKFSGGCGFLQFLLFMLIIFLHFAIASMVIYYISKKYRRRTE